LIPPLVDLFVPEPATAVQGQPLDKVGITYLVWMRVVQSSQAESGTVSPPAVETDQGRCRSSSPRLPSESGSSVVGFPTRLPAHARLAPMDGHVESSHSRVPCKASCASNALSSTNHTIGDGTSSLVPQAAMELWPAGDRCDASAEKDPSGSISRLMLIEIIPCPDPVDRLVM
jgi:hypothetical protein